MLDGLCSADEREVCLSDDRRTVSIRSERTERLVCVRLPRAESRGSLCAAKKPQCGRTGVSWTGVSRSKPPAACLTSVYPGACSSALPVLGGAGGRRDPVSQLQRRNAAKSGAGTQPTPAQERMVGLELFPQCNILGCPGGRAPTRGISSAFPDTRSRALTSSTTAGKALPIAVWCCRGRPSRPPF